MRAARVLLVLVSVAAAVLAPTAGAEGPPGPVIAVHAPKNTKPGDVVTFDAGKSTGTASFVWDFNDGGQADGRLVRHRFPASGTYLVSLTGRNAAGQWTSVYQTIDIGEIFADAETTSVGGADLNGTVTRPKTNRRVPALLEYGPYGAGGVSAGNWNRILVRSGYAFVKVNMPGRGISGGRFDMFGPATAQGGYDVIEWIAKQPWSNGKVALTGFSGPAVAALSTLRTQPPHLVTASVKGAFGDMYRDIVHPGGTVNSNTFVNGWNALFAAEASSTKTDTRLVDVPGREADTISVAAQMNARVLDDPWWQERRYVDRPVGVPVLYYGTNRDLWPRAAPELLQWLRPAGGRVLLTYGGHGPIDPTGYQPSMHVFADGSYSGENVLGETRAWFDHFLKGVKNGVERRPALSVLVPRDADNNAARGYRWLGLSSWPDRQIRWSKLLLDGGGLLSTTAARSTAPDTALAGAGWGTSGQAAVDDAQSLVFQTPPLTQDVTVAGPAALRLFASLEGVDLAWNVQLQEVLPDGRVRLVNDGALQASHRRLNKARSRVNTAGDVIVPFYDHTAIEPVQPSVTLPYDVEIPTVFNTFSKGSQIRVTIVGNDGRTSLDGHITAPQSLRYSIFHDVLRPSALMLPVIPNPERLALPLPYTLPDGRR